MGLVVMTTRRAFLKRSAGLAAGAFLCPAAMLEHFQFPVLPGVTGSGISMEKILRAKRLLESASIAQDEPYYCVVTKESYLACVPGATEAEWDEMVANAEPLQEGD